MTAYNTLFRIKKMELQSCQQQKIKLEDALVSLKQREIDLDQEMQAQNELVKENNSFRLTYGFFFERYKQRKENCQKEQELAQRELSQLLQTMRIKFSEMKKMELLEEKQQEKERQKLAKHEVQAQDEQTVIRVVRENFELNF